MIDFIKWNPQKYNPMNDKWSRCAAGRLLMFMGGIVASAAVTQHLAEKAAREKYDEQLAEVKEYYAAKQDVSDDDIEAAAEELIEDVVDQLDDTDPRNYDNPDIDVIQMNMGDHRNHYTDSKTPRVDALLDEYGGSQVNMNAPVDPHRGRARNKRDKIYLLTQDEYEEDFEHQEKVSVLWYNEDQVLVDPFDEMVDDASRVLGHGFEHNFQVVKGQEVAYVRNTSLGMDYEVELIRGSYNRDVLGYIDIPEPRKPRSQRDEE